MSTELETYSNELLLALRLRDVPGPRIAEALAEVQSHVSETGEDALEAFGPPRDYADELALALGTTSSAWWRAALSWRTLRYAAGGFLGAQLLLSGVLGLLVGDAAWLGLPAAVAVAVGVGVLGVTAIGLRRLARSDDSPVLDPRTGADLTPPLPRWALPVMVLLPVLTALLAAAGSLVGR